MTECCDRVKIAVDARIQKKRLELELIVKRNRLVNRENSPKFIQDIGRMLPELREIDKYTCIIREIGNETFCSLTSACVEHIESYVIYLGIHAKDCVVFCAFDTNETSCGIDDKRTISQNLD